MALWADALFAMDRQWWIGKKEKRFKFSGYLEDVKARFAGERYTTAFTVPDVVRLEKRDMESYGNSGAAAVSMAAYFGASHITLIGYDCRKTSMSHYHGDHVKGLGNAGPIKTWPERFRKLSGKINGVDVANCTPGSLIDCFRFSTLSERLG